MMPAKFICSAIVCMVVASAWSAGAVAQVPFAKDFTGIKTIAILPPRIEVFELGAGSMLEKIDEWSVRAVDTVTAALDLELQQRPEVKRVIVREEALSPEQKAELEELHALYNVVRGSFVQHVFGLQNEYFEEKQTNFDYSLGKETARLMLPEIDALLIIRGVDQISSVGRHALNAMTMAASIAMGTFYMLPSGLAQLSVALVDAKTGDILWYGGTGGGAGTDLREASSSTRLVRELFVKFPLGTAPHVQAASKRLDD